MKKLSALLLALSLVCCSCGQDNPADDIAENTTEAVTETTTEETIDFVGKWQGIKIIEDGEESDVFQNMPVWAIYQIELCEDGSVKLGETTAEIAGHKNSWRWNRTENSTEIEFFDSENTDDINTLTFDGNYLVYEESSEILYLEKVDEFTPYNPEEATTTENVTHEYIDADPTVFLGKWETRGLTVDSDKQYLMGKPLMNVCQFEIYDDHTAVISGAEIVDSEKFLVCEWGMVSKTELELLDVNGKNLLFTLDGNYLVCNVDSIVVSLGRVEEFTPKQPKEKITENITHEYIEITDPAILYGKWQGEYMIDENGDKIISDAIPMIYQFDFHEDGTLSFGEVLSEAYDAGDYTWEVTDSYTVATHYVYSTEDTDEDETIYFDGEHLIYSEGEYNDVYLEKVDEFIPVDPEEFYGLY